MAKSKAIAKKAKGTALVSMAELEKLYAAEAQEEVDKEAAGGVPTISTRGKKFKIDGQTLPDPLPVIVLGSAMINAYYDREYDPENPSPPACTAIGAVGDEPKMAPPDTVPHKQAEKCMGCPKAAFGTADKGKGKACKNDRRVVFMSAEDKKDEPILMQMMIPPTGLKKFSTYVKTIKSAYDRPLHGMVTLFTFDEDQDWPVPVAKPANKINDVSLATRVKAARERALKDVVMVPLNTANYQEPGAVSKKPKKNDKVEGAAKRKRKF